MPIKKSSAPQIQRLIDDLRTTDGVRREAAVARLAVIGARVVPQVLAVVDSTEPLPIRVAAMRALEGLEDQRVLEAANTRLDESADLAGSALAVLKSLLPTGLGAAALDSLTAAALDGQRPEALRLSVLDALADMPKRTLRPIWTRLLKDPSAAIRQRVGSPPPAPPAGPAASSAGPIDSLDSAASGATLDPASVRRALSAGGSTAPFPTLHRLIQVIREREGGLKDRVARVQWTIVRGSVHHQLASRGSRVALYDVRESLEQTDTPLPVEFLATLAEIGDRSCVEPLAQAYARSAKLKATGTEWWRQHLLSTLRTIVSRERLTKRHAVIKRVLAKWPELKSQIFLT